MKPTRLCLLMLLGAALAVAPPAEAGHVAGVVAASNGAGDQAELEAWPTEEGMLLGVRYAGQVPARQRCQVERVRVPPRDRAPARQRLASRDVCR